MKIEFFCLIFLHHLISFVFLRCFFPMILVTLKYFFSLLTFMTSNSSDFSTLCDYSFLVPFGDSSSSVHLSSVSVSLNSVSENFSLFTLSLVFHFPGFSCQLCADYFQRYCGIFRPKSRPLPDFSRCSMDISNSLCPQLNSLSLFPNLFFLIFSLVNGSTPVASTSGCHS